MRASLGAALSCAVLAFSGCHSSQSNERTYSLQGQVLSVTPDRQEATIKHEEIKGFMPAMTMPYKVKEPALLEHVAPGDLINATLVVEPNDAYLSRLAKVGEAPLEQPPPDAPAPKASSGFELIRPGESVPDGRFVDQDGHARTFASFKGSPIVLTFIYTKCPLPTFCPLMDRHFVTIQDRTGNDAALKKVRLVTVSFDPATDTPAVLKKHARELNADLKRWTFLTGDRDEIDQFAARFGVTVARAMNDQRDITHNLRTAIVGADGRLVKVYTGNEWTPDEILKDLEPVAGS
jgi:protein SCO1